MRLEKLYHNLHVLHEEDRKVYFSYETPIAIQVNGNELILSENVWTRTTGKHINIIKEAVGRYKQVEHDVFQEYLTLSIY